MREILFRGKRTDNGEWVEGYLYITHNGEHEISVYNEEVNIERWTHEVDPSTVCQYTGLTDKNGNKIFDGDIVKRLGDKCVVKWTEEDAKFIIIGSMTKLDFSLCFAENLEVIGNIHDNPDLLEK